MRFHGFCRSMFQRARPRTTRTSRASAMRGRDDYVLDRSLPLDRAAAEGTQGQGPRITESSALPPGIAPARDFAPTLIASGSSRRGHCASPRPEAARGQAKPPAPRHTSKAWATTGPRHARPPRRDSTCGCPRGLPSQGRSRTGMDRRWPKPVRWSSPAPFSLPLSRARDARTVPGSPAFR